MMRRKTNYGAGSQTQEDVMREWMRDKDAVFFTVIIIAYFCLIATAVVNAETEYKTLRVGEADTVIDCRTVLETVDHVENDCGDLLMAIYKSHTICDTFVIKAVKRYKFPLQDGECLDSMKIISCPRCDWPQPIEIVVNKPAPRYECKKFRRFGRGSTILGDMLLCSHPECAPSPCKCEFDKFTAHIVDGWNEDDPPGIVINRNGLTWFSFELGESYNLHLVGNPCKCCGGK